MKDLKDAGDIADRVAMEIGEALLPMVPDTVADANSHDGTARRVTHYNAPTTNPGELTNGTDTVTAPAVTARTFHDDNSPGRTWAMIVGEDNVMMERIGTANAALPVSVHRRHGRVVRG